MAILFKGHWLFILLLMAGCAGPSKTQSYKPHLPAEAYHSQPEVIKASNDTFDVHIQPIKVKKPYYVGFQLTVKNKTSSALFIDWHRTRFIHDGKDQGNFIFKGIYPDDIEKGLPKESLAAGALISKPIYPIMTIVSMPKGDIVDQEVSNFSPGILPVGTNAALLAITQGVRQWRQAMTFKLDLKKIQ
jgi:hypothetical protein